MTTDEYVKTSGIHARPQIYTNEHRKISHPLPRITRSFTKEIQIEASNDRQLETAVKELMKETK